ncbi:hypothetical protein SAMN02745866_01768 [Alteromonadaceae bacterium Bs31]|nr:hypothetical protein SAMN02745866_01768 [Alteromonadaceae bacterium Bs31]
MKATPIANAVKGEKIVDIRPQLELYPQVAWKQRLQHFSGRALTQYGLNREQNWLNGQLAAMGRVVAAGVLEGLNVNLQTDVQAGEDVLALQHLHISAGRALSCGGNPIVANRDFSVPLENLMVFRHNLHPQFNTGDTGEPSGYARELPVFSELREEGTIPRAGILVLEPHFAEIWQAEDEDACPVDESNLPFENWQLVDACRLVLYTWPDPWLPMPSPGEAWRNRLAQAVFEKERSMDAHQVHPWQLLGAPLALLGFDEQFNIAFVDRHAVVRSGGSLGINGNGLRGEGNPLLWQAQLEQFNKQLALLAMENSGHEDLPGLARQHFRYLPPVGVLPKNFAQPKNNEQYFFPVNYSVRARVIPLEQLDVAIRESQPLLPFDLNSFDDVELLVPVQQNFYDADLLRSEALDPAFDLAIQEFTEERNEWLGRRRDVRKKAAAIYFAMKGRALETPRDEDALDNLELPSPQQAALIELGSSWRTLAADSPPANWNIPGFDDSAFGAQRSGWGYGKTLFETRVEQARGRDKFLFMRKSFLLEQGDLSNLFELQVSTNASFVVHLNGSQIFSHSPVNQKSILFGVRTRVNELTFNFAEEAMAALNDGNNTLAISVQLPPTNQADFYFSPRLVKTLSQENYQALQIDEEDFGLTPNLQASNATAAEPGFIIDEIETFKTQVRAASPRLISEEELGQLDANGLEDFIQLLDLKIASTNDLIDFNFARMRTEIYRIDQYIFGNEQGTKLATSPVLASIAQSSSSPETLKQLNVFFEGLKSEEQAAVVATGESNSGGDSQGAGSPQPASGLVRQPAGDLFLSEDLSRTLSRSESLSLASRSTELSGVSLSLGSSSLAGESLAISDTFSSPFAREDSIFIAERDAGVAGSVAAKSGFASNALFTSAATVNDVQEQSAIVGATAQYRNVSVGERLTESVALSSITSGVATKASVLTGLREQSGMVLDGITIPGVSNTENPEQPVDLGSVSDLTISEILNFDHDLDPNQALDETTYFTGTIKALENTGVVLRKVEGRVHSYKRLRSQCQQILNTIQAQFKRCDYRLAELMQPLAEARHDLSVARSLLAEEESRVAKINARREGVLQKHVPYFVYRRPRFNFSHESAPVHTLFEKHNPGLPQCDLPDRETSAELAALIKLLKQVPIKWLTKGEKLTSSLNRTDAVYMLAEYSYNTIDKSLSHLDGLQGVEFGKSQLGAMWASAMASNIGVLQASIKAFNKDKYIKILRKDWREANKSARDVCRLADLIEGTHGKAATSRDAAELLENIRSVLSCIYHNFSDVLPAVRVQWIDKFSQFDQSVAMNNLYNLPQWEQVDYEIRRDAQKLVTWLYSQFDSSFENAQVFVDNLVRMCILLASNAPVGKLIAGEVKRQSSAKKGEEIEVTIPPQKVNIGDLIEINHGGKRIGKGIIRDIGKQGAKLELTDLKQGVQEVPQGAKVSVRQGNRPTSKKHKTPEKRVEVKQAGLEKKIARTRPRVFF